MSNMFKKQVDYFDMFSQGVAISLEAAKYLDASFADGAINKDELALIKEAEHKGDKHVHASLKVIEEAFITPIDRTDIIDIIKGIENITDSIDDIAAHIYMMNIKNSNDSLVKFVSLTVESCEKLHELMQNLKQFKKQSKIINDLIIEINHLEEVGDATYSSSMRTLFETETDPINIIKLKELYQRMETALDCCEDVADMVEKIMISAS